MKRLLLLAIVTVVAATAGCRSHNWFNRGAPCATCPPMATDPYTAGPSADVPAGATYLPGPS